MKIAYYRDKETKSITNFHKIPEDWDDKKTSDSIRDFNNNTNNKTTAVIIDVPENSLMEYLVNRCFRKLELEKELRDDLINNLREALDIAEDIKINL